MRDTDWMTQAACRPFVAAGRDYWFPDNINERRDEVRTAIRICNGCPVRNECLDYAHNSGLYGDGIFGGMTGKQRRDLARRTGRTLHGTVEGYKQGCRALCCRRANAEHKADLRAAQRDGTYVDGRSGDTWAGWALLPSGPMLERVARAGDVGWSSTDRRAMSRARTRGRVSELVASRLLAQVGSSVDAVYTSREVAS